MGAHRNISRISVPLIPKLFNASRCRVGILTSTATSSRRVPAKQEVGLVKNGAVGVKACTSGYGGLDTLKRSVVWRGMCPLFSHKMRTEGSRHRLWLLFFQRSRRHAPKHSYDGRLFVFTSVNKFPSSLKFTNTTLMSRSTSFSYITLTNSIRHREPFKALGQVRTLRQSVLRYTHLLSLTDRL